VRAASTWKKMRKRMPCEARVLAEPRLYLADPRTMLEVLRGAREAVVMMIGHNPGCAIFAAGMYQAPSAHPDFNRFPTCATCIFDFEIENWSEVEPGTGEIVDFIVPRQLLG
jgi:phosphohistidine phosphatase